ncbi:hypothetical protein, partial [Bradyrhizobium sp. 62]|uniref:hypothetical protein n=1 Tax=Bradyrhizobium sp. 62 TaxID=1043588 RepID=UPI001FFB7527
AAALAIDFPRRRKRAPPARRIRQTSPGPIVMHGSQIARPMVGAPVLVVIWTLLRRGLDKVSLLNNGRHGPAGVTDRGALAGAVDLLHTSRGVIPGFPPF